MPKSKTILFIDDNPVDRALISSLLTKRDFNVLLAEDGNVGLKKAMEEKPDLILLDVVMPKVNGYAFLFDVKKVDQRGQTPIIVLTCKDEMKDLFKVEGVKEYIVKPFANKDLLAMIRKHI